MMAVDVTTDPFTVGTPRGLFEGVYESGGYDVTPDGRRFLMVALDAPASAVSKPQMVLVLNWREELKHMPTK